MNALALLDELRAAGAVVEPRGDRLHVDAPAGVLTPERVAELRARKAELLALLAPPAEVVDLATARARLVVAGCLRRRGDGRVSTPRGPGRLLSFVAQHPDRCQVLLDVDQSRAVELPVADVEPEVSA